MLIQSLGSKTGSKSEVAIAQSKTSALLFRPKEKGRATGQ